MTTILIISALVILASIRLPLIMFLGVFMAVSIPATIAIHGLNSPGSATDSTDVQHASQISFSEILSVE